MGQKTKDNSIQARSQITYDDFPYEGFPYSYTRPEHLRTLGLLFGMNPPAIETAKILDIGCAEGANMISFAESYPESYTLGVDLSKVQIQNGMKILNDLGLKNIDLKHLSITDLNESFGTFDYIICHGVISWVPSIVREKILEVTKKLLHKNGIAFISYNTLPGWNMQKSIRDMMMFHATGFTDNASKLQQAKLFLDFVNDSLEGVDTTYSKFLRDETKSLKSLNDSHIIHEYLGEENTAFSFYEFASMAKAHNLNYVGDSILSSMFIGNLPPKAAEKLQAVNDIIKTEQYIDFISNRRFRRSILCHDSVALNRTITADKLQQFYTTLNVYPAVSEDKVDLNNQLESLNFNYNNNEKFALSTTSPAMKAILYVYSENLGNPLTLEAVASLAEKKLHKGNIEAIKTELGQTITKMLLEGYVQIFATKPVSIYEITEKPLVSSLAIYQAKNFGKPNVFVTNSINNPMLIQLHEQYIVALLDGEHTIDNVKSELLKKFNEGVLVVSNENGTITDEKLLKSFADHAVDEALQKFKVNYLLIG